MLTTSFNRFFRMARSMVLLFAIAACIRADTIDLSRHGSFTLSHGQQMTVQFSVWNYGYNNPGVSPYPTSIGLELVGAHPASAEMAGVPGSSGSYFPAYLLEGRIQSLDGSVSAPLQSSVASLLGLASGSLVLTPAMFHGRDGGSPVATVNAQTALSLSLSEQIFGPNVASRQSSALLVLLNLGDDMTIGLGEDVSLRNAISEPSITGYGNVQTAGITTRVLLTEVPEPGTITLTLVLMFGLGVWAVRKARA